MESLCSLKNPVLYELPNACYREQFPHFLRLTLHAEEYGTSLSENVLNLVHAKRIHFIDIQELIDAEKIEGSVNDFSYGLLKCGKEITPTLNGKPYDWKCESGYAREFQRIKKI